MPDFIYDKKIYYNPVEFALDRIGGTWKMPVLWRLREKTLRYGELKQQLPHISDKMLSGVLRSLEAEGFITRKVGCTENPSRLRRFWGLCLPRANRDVVTSPFRAPATNTNTQWIDRVAISSRL